MKKVVQIISENEVSLDDTSKDKFYAYKTKKENRILTGLRINNKSLYGFVDLSCTAYDLIDTSSSLIHCIEIAINRGRDVYEFNTSKEMLKFLFN